MLIRSAVSVAVALTVIAGAAWAADPYPGMADSMAPGGVYTGTPDYGKATATNTAQRQRCFADFDSNGDGGLDPAELSAHPQLSKRFSTRDANRDGRLSRDEYQFVC